MTYGQLARDLSLRMGELTAALEALMVEDTAKGHPLRAALLCQRLSPDRLPAPGFFQTAAALGHIIDDAKAFAESHRNAYFLSRSIPG